MSKLSAIGARSPIRAHHLTEEDRSTHRRWARSSYLVYLIIIALLAAGLALLGRQGAGVAGQGQTAGAGDGAMSAPQGGIRKRGYF